MRFRDNTISFLKNTVTVIMGLILFALFIMSGFSTAMIEDIREYTYYTCDNVWLNILAVGLFCLTLTFICRLSGTKALIKRINDDNKLYGIIMAVLILLATIAGIAFVSLAHEIPSYDQKSLYIHSKRLMNGNYSSLDPGGYLNQYPHQYGMIFLTALFQLILGIDNYLAFQVINVFGIALIYFLLAGIFKESGRSNSVCLGVVLISIGFLPLLMYSVLCYGTVWGLAFSLLGYYFYLKLKKNNKLIFFLLSLISFAFAIIVKQNSSIFLLGTFASIIVQKEKKKLQYAFIFLLLITCIVAPKIPVKVMETITEVKTEQRVYTLNWVAMGLQDGNVNGTNGWYNRYVGVTYRNCGFDIEKQKDVDIVEIKSRLKAFAEDPSYAWEFFWKKNSSQWNNPTFQIFWIMSVTDNKTSGPKWLCKLLTYPTKSIIIEYMNLVHFIIISLALVNCLHFRKRNESDFFLFATFIGGFLFHSVWEAKPMYTLPYFVLLLPLAAEGIEKIVKAPVQIREGENKSETVRLIILLTAIFVAFVTYSCISTPYKQKCISDTSEYEAYVENNTYLFTDNGRYRIENKYGSIEADISFAGDKSYLISEKINETVNISLKKRFNIKKSKQEGYYNLVFSNNYALTYSTVNKCFELQEYRDSKKQQFKLILIE